MFKQLSKKSIQKTAVVQEKMAGKNGVYLADNRPERQVVQRVIKKPWKQGRKRLVSSQQGKKKDRKAKWLRIWEEASPYRMEAGITVSNAHKFQALMKRRGEEEMMVHYMKLAAVKGLTYEELLPMVTTGDDVKSRGFPYPFTKKTQYSTFKSGIIKLAHQLKLNYTSIHVQGSAIRKANPHDVDIGIMITRPEFDRMYSMLVNRMDQIGEPANSKGRKKALKSLRKGKFGPHDLRFFAEASGGAMIPIFDRTGAIMSAAVGEANAIPVQFSAILIGGQLDSKPFMSF